MENLLELLKRCAENCEFDSGDPHCKTVLEQLYRAYAESHESDPPEVREMFRELDEFLGGLPFKDNNAVFSMCCQLCIAHERRAFINGFYYGARLMTELK